MGVNNANLLIGTSLISLYVLILAMLSFLTYDFCGNDPYNISIILPYQPNFISLCIGSVMQLVILVLIPWCIFGFVIYKILKKRNMYEII